MKKVLPDNHLPHCPTPDSVIDRIPCSKANNRGLLCVLNVCKICQPSIPGSIISRISMHNHPSAQDKAHLCHQKRLNDITRFGKPLRYPFLGPLISSISRIFMKIICHKSYVIETPGSLQNCNAAVRLPWTFFRFLKTHSHDKDINMLKRYLVLR